MLRDIENIEFGHKNQIQQQKQSNKTTVHLNTGIPTKSELSTLYHPQHTSHIASFCARVLANFHRSTCTENISSNCSIITPSLATATATKVNELSKIEYCNNLDETTTETHMTLLSLRRRRILQRQACLLSILAAFVLGLVLGVFMPMLGITNVLHRITSHVGGENGANAPANINLSHSLPMNGFVSLPIISTDHVQRSSDFRPPSDFPTIYEVNPSLSVDIKTTTPSAIVQSPFSVAFIKEEHVEMTAEEVFRNAFHLEQDKNSPDNMIVKKFDAEDGSIKEFRVQRTADGRFRKGPERKLSKPSLAQTILSNGGDGAGKNLDAIKFAPMAQKIVEYTQSRQDRGIIKDDIYWGDLVEKALPKGFSALDNTKWNHYVGSQGEVERLETGCGRMQNRMVIFKDGTRACARYRQNTDQIQGELFSFYLGQLLNITNLAPSAAAVIDLESRTWSSALADITQAQWKQQRPVVLTRWLPDLEPAGIPQPFQPLERHLNKFDVWNITLGAAAEATRFEPKPIAIAPMSMENQNGLLKRLEAANSVPFNHQSPTLESSSSSSVREAAAVTATLDGAANSLAAAGASSPVLRRLIELAQWSDLIVFDYLIANLDRVVNNLYNFQWNADIMAAPAHNLARQIDSQLLVFLDNESGLLHGYRLLKKYEAYHGLLLDNLCVFRQPTIEALRQLRTNGPSKQLRELFERTTNSAVRNVLPTLPDKSIKILVDRIDRVLQQVQKCKELLADS